MYTKIRQSDRRILILMNKKSIFPHDPTEIKTRNFYFCYCSPYREARKEGRKFFP